MPLTLTEHASLKSLNTFGFDVNSRYLCQIDREDHISELIQLRNALNTPLLILGGGSNVLFTQNFEGLVALNRLMGISIEKTDADSVWVSAAAGENWHEFVMWTVNNGFGGLENLSLIPGCVGAGPMQNIGAYGVEIKDCFDHLEAFDLNNGQKRTFSKEDCKFGYRESVFKRELKGQFLISRVHFKLSKNPKPQTSYGAIAEELSKMGVTEPKIKDVSKAVIAIRQSKLPDPKFIGNAGSFFKNPVVSAETALQLKEKYPDMPLYPSGDSEMKLAAGWLIEKAGWKGHEVDKRFGVHPKQALVLVHYQGASGAELYRLSEQIVNDILNKFGISLEREVNIL